MFFFRAHEEAEQNVKTLAVFTRDGTKTKLPLFFSGDRCVRVCVYIARALLFRALRARI